MYGSKVGRMKKKTTEKVITKSNEQRDIAGHDEPHRYLFMFTTHSFINIMFVQINYKNRYSRWNDRLNLFFLCFSFGFHRWMLCTIPSLSRLSRQPWVKWLREKKWTEGERERETNREKRKKKRLQPMQAESHKIWANRLGLCKQ